MDRREFLTSAAGGLSAAALPGMGRADEADPVGTYGPFFKKDLFPDPVVLESLDLFHRDGNWFARARSKDGAEGWAVSHPKRMGVCYPMFVKIVAPYLVGKDVRNIERLVDDVYLGHGAGSHYKMQGQLFWVPVATAEFAILDLLGRIAKRSAAELLGGVRRNAIELYIANNHRHLGPAESLRRIQASVEKINAKAVKFKIGGRMKVIDQVPGRTEKLIPLVAKSLGDRCTIYADANSSYVSVKHAIRIGRLLEEHKIAFYEEPCPFDYYEETRQVAEALDIPIAWGEQESSQRRFKWMIDRGGIQVAQPDLFYYGGLIRSLRVAKMAEAKGLACTPHISGGGLGFLYMGIFATTCPNPGAHQEYKGLHQDFPWSSTGEAIAVKDGAMTAPNGPGIGVEIAADFLAKAKQVRA